MFSDKQMLQHRVKQSMSKQQHHSTPSPTRRNARNINSFELLYNRPKCYICHNFGHKTTECYLKNYESNSRVDYSVKKEKVWKKKENNQCGLVLSAQRQKDS